MLKCDDCDLEYEITYTNDGMDDPPINFCPRCGSNNLQESDTNLPMKPFTED